jgi:sulfur relay (sulfurtransferase) DsrC/TusE family protein
MNKLLKDAIADAKAVRETALANAKFALQEAFAPKIQSMLSHKIKEEMEEEEEVEVEEPSNDEEAALESRMRNNTGLYEDDDIFGDEAGEGAADVAGNDPEAVAEDHEDEEYSDDRGLESEPADDDQISDEELAELIRELEGEDEAEAPAEEEELEEGEDEEYEEAPTSEGRKKNKMKMMEMEDEEVSDEEGEEEVNIEEIIRALREEDEEGAEDTKAAEETEEELEEAYKVIKFLRSKLHEVNLLNAKLLYVNKLIKKEGLTESQKIKIIETFDRAKNVREAKLIYTTLAESVMKRIAKVSTTKTKMVEGFASKGQKPTTKILSENKIYNRFTELVKFNR